MRHIFIGDIHGCYDELMRLLDIVNPQSEDVVVSVGDMVRKGPAPDRCLDLWRRAGYLAVTGNQEQKLLQLIEENAVHSAADRAVATRPDLVEAIRRWPLFVDFPKERIAVVHGGVMPETTFTPHSIEAQRETITTLRYLRRTGKGWMPVPKNGERDGDRFWTELWDGERMVVYGHTPRAEARRDAKAIGLDTACVYGGKLTAAVCTDGAWDFVSVKAARRYSSPSIAGRLRKWFRSLHD